jgi:peroxiredoxin Q/BCP
MAPDFTLPGEGGDDFTLSAHRGKPLVLYFYPKDDTPGCTTEAIDFTRAKPDFDKMGVAIAGLSPDPVARHEKFRDKHNLGIALVSDENHEAALAYGVWKEKSLYGRRFMGIERSTFLVDAEGRIARVWRKVKVSGHVGEVLAAARELTG